MRHPSSRALNHPLYPPPNPIEPFTTGQPNNRAGSTPKPSPLHRRDGRVLPPSRANGLWRFAAAAATAVSDTQHQPARHTDMYVDLESRGDGGGGSGFSCVQKKRRVISESILQSPRRHQIPAADASPARRLCRAVALDLIADYARGSLWPRPALRNV